MVSFTQFLTEASGPFTLYHGGRDLESSYRDTINHTRGNWEYGPGLYLTTRYETAAKYAKGGGRIYRVTVAPGRDITQVQIDWPTVMAFVNGMVIGSKRKPLLDRLRDLMARRNSEKVGIEYVLNLVINDNAIQNTKSGALKDWLTSNGADYSIVTGYGGRSETIVVVFNAAKIVKVEWVRNVPVSDWELPAPTV